MLKIATGDERIDAYDVKKTFIINKATGEKFINASFNDVEMIIDDITGYVNITRVCTINGKAIDNYLLNTATLRDMLIYAKYQGVFDVFDIPNEVNCTTVVTSEVEASSTTFEEGGRNITDDNYTSPVTGEVEINTKWLSEHKDQLISIYNDRSRKITLTPKELREVYDHLPFIDKRKVNNGYNKHVRGTYLHPLLIHPIAEYADMEYACRVMRLMHTINHENKLKNQMFEKKITEKENKLEELKDKHEKSIRGWNSERPGCIKIKQYVEDKCIRRFDLFRVYADEIENKLDEPGVYVVNNVYNPQKTCSLLQIYARNGHFDDITTYNRRNVLQTKSIDIIKARIDDIQNHRVRPPSLEVIKESIKRSFGRNGIDFKARMFEVYCAMKSGLQLFKYTQTELLGLTKVDKGLDLLDEDTLKMGQCKYYIQVPLGLNSLHRFLQYKEAYPEGTFELYISSLTLLSNSLLDIQGIKIIRIDDDEFTKWFENETKDVTIVKEKPYLHVDHEMYKNAQTWLSKELEEKPFVYLDDVWTYINNTFGMNIKQKTVFGRMFGHIYQRGDHRNVKYIDTGNKKQILVHPSKLIPTIVNGEIKNTIKKSFITLSNEDIQKEREFLIKTIGYGQYLWSDLLQKYKDEFGRETNSVTLIGTHRDIFEVCSENSGKRPVLTTRRINKVKTYIYDLNMSVIPDKAKVFNNFINEHNGMDKSSLVQLFNSTFHRYESIRYFNCLVERIRKSVETGEKI